MKKRDVSLDEAFKFIHDKTLEENEFCSVTDVAEEFGISRDKSQDLLNSLVEDGRLVIVFKNPRIRVYAPREVIQYIVRVRKKPKWIENYLLPNKKKHLGQKKRLDKNLYEYERFEELLYLKDKTLEESVMFALKWLGFEVKRLPEDAFADLEAKKGTFLVAIEVSGGNAGCPMSKVRQLSDYFAKTLEEEKREIKNLLLLFNHFHDIHVRERKEAFAPEIRKAADRYQINLVTTRQLYEKIRCVKSGEVTKEQIAEQIIEGKWD